MQRILSLQRVSTSLRSKIFKPSTRCMSSLPPHEIVGMPSLSPTMETGTLSKWLMNVGDEVTPGDGIADIATDKASMTFESTDDFFIAKLLVEEGAEVVVGAPVFISVEDKDDIAAFANYIVADTPAAPVAEPTPVPVVTAPTPTPVTVAPTPVAVTTPAPIAAPTPAPTPTPAAASTPTGDFQWGQRVKSSALSKKMSTEQTNYINKYGRTGHQAI